VCSSLRHLADACCEGGGLQGELDLLRQIKTRRGLQPARADSKPPDCRWLGLHRMLACADHHAGRGWSPRRGGARLLRAGRSQRAVLPLRRRISISCVRNKANALSAACALRRRRHERQAHTIGHPRQPDDQRPLANRAAYAHMELPPQRSLLPLRLHHCIPARRATSSCSACPGNSTPRANNRAVKLQHFACSRRHGCSLVSPT